MYHVCGILNAIKAFAKEDLIGWCDVPCGTYITGKSIKFNQKDYEAYKEALRESCTDQNYEDQFKVTINNILKHKGCI